MRSWIRMQQSGAYNAPGGSETSEPHLRRPRARRRTECLGWVQRLCKCCTRASTNSLLLMKSVQGRELHLSQCRGALKGCGFACYPSNHSALRICKCDYLCLKAPSLINGTHLMRVELRCFIYTRAMPYGDKRPSGVLGGVDGNYGAAAAVAFDRSSARVVASGWSCTSALSTPANWPFPSHVRLVNK